MHGFQFDESKKVYEDLLFLYEVAKKSSVTVFTSVPLYYYCNNDGTSVARSLFDDRKMDIINVSQYILDDITASKPSMKHVAKREFVRNNIMCASLAKAKFKFSDNFFIDTFTFDLISIDESKIDSYWQRSQQYAKNYSQSVLGKVSELQLLEKAYKVPVYSKELEKYANDLYQKIECKLKTDEKSDQTFIAESIIDGYFFREEEYYWRYEDVFPLLENEVEFEGQIYSVANQYLKRLKAYYGDIWRLPQSISSLHSNEFNESLDDDIKRLLEMKII